MAVTYFVLDAQDRIIEIGAGWDVFALDNDGPEACSRPLLGTVLWEKMTSQQIRVFWRALFFASRRWHKPFSFPIYRDSSTERRRFRMTVTPGEKEKLCVEFQPEHLLPEDDEAVPLAVSPDGAGRCAVCCRPVAGSLWMEPPQPSPSGSYEVICTDCRELALKTIEAMRPEAGV